MIYKVIPKKKEEHLYLMNITCYSPYAAFAIFNHINRKGEKFKRSELTIKVKKNL